MLPELGADTDISENPGGAITAILAGLVALATFLVFIATVIAFLMWLYRSANNLYAFGYWKSQIGHSPGWSVGSFFVPFVNLFVPYRAVKEVWQKSHPANSVSFSFTTSPPDGHFGC
jgi:hypothetical protein